MSMKKNTGYTLIELMTMMAVAAVLLTFGVPQLKVYFQSNQMVSNTNDLVTALNLARAEAIKRGLRATVCMSSAATTAPLCDGTNWEDGWIVFAKAATATVDKANVYQPSNGDTLLRAHPKVDGAATIRPHGGITSYVSFTSRGNPLSIAGDSQDGVFSICDARGLSVARGVELNAAGSIRSTGDPAKIVSCP
jgi:type IV fimbrial biogenesis protein FimT